jgi:hypothetical protein
MSQQKSDLIAAICREKLERPGRAAVTARRDLSKQTQESAMTVSYITSFAAITRFHAQMTRAARLADRTGDEAPYEAASDRLWDAINMVREHGTAADKASLRTFLLKHYAYILPGTATAAG